MHLDSSEIANIEKGIRIEVLQKTPGEMSCHSRGDRPIPNATVIVVQDSLGMVSNMATTSIDGHIELPRGIEDTVFFTGMVFIDNTLVYEGYIGGNMKFYI